MPSFIEELMGSLGPEVSNQLSSTHGLDANTASQILPQVAPMILGGLKRQMEERGGRLLGDLPGAVMGGGKRR